MTANTVASRAVERRMLVHMIGSLEDICGVVETGKENLFRSHARKSAAEPSTPLPETGKYPVRQVRPKELIVAPSEPGAGNGLPMTETRSVTIVDVAALAGVSIGTVSKALNGRGQLRAETRRRVLAASEQLGFRPNPFARGLLSGRSYTVGLITTDSFGRFTIPSCWGPRMPLARARCRRCCVTRGDPIREAHYVRTLLSRKVDGIIVTGRRSDPRPPIDPRLPVPVGIRDDPVGEPW
jgi:hypothetical protein